VIECGFRSSMIREFTQGVWNRTRKLAHGAMQELFSLKRAFCFSWISGAVNIKCQARTGPSDHASATGAFSSSAFVGNVK
jgi:hypothetical protein